MKKHNIFKPNKPFFNKNNFVNNSNTANNKKK